MSRSSTFKLLVYLVSALLLGRSSAIAQSRTFLVDSQNDTSDAVPGDGICADAAGACSLRAAIMEANGTTVPQGDRVLVPAGLYLLSLGPIRVTATMSIIGAGSGRTVIDGSTGTSGLFELGRVLYARKLFQPRDTVTGLLVPRAVATTTASFTNCLAAEGCLGKPGLVDAGGSDPIHPLSFDFTLSPAEQASIAESGVGVFRVSAARDIGRKVAATTPDVAQVSIDGTVSADELFTDTIDNCPPGENDPINLECGPNFHTDRPAESGIFISEASFQSAAADGQIQMTITPVGTGSAGVGRLKIFSAELLYLKSLHVTMRGIALQEAANSALLNTGAVLDGFDLVFRDNTAPVGAAIWNIFGNVTLLDSTIAHNSAFAGGGMLNAPLASAALERCTVSGNESTVHSGGGMFNSGSLSLVNTTISGNRAKLGGGGLYNQGRLSINFTTISSNSANFDLASNFNRDAVGGGISNALGGTVTIANSILAQNFDGRDTGLPAPPDLVSPDCSSPPLATLPRGFLSERDNVVGILSSSCNVRDRDPAVAGTPFDQVGVASAPLDPALDPLADNGGYAMTHALQTGSPAIDADGDLSPVLGFRCPPGDERGFRRPGDDPADTICDAGAYEAGGRTALPLDLATGTSPVTVTFSNVAQPGLTQLEIRSTGPTPPSGFMLGAPPLFYELSTTTIFTPPLTVCIRYGGTSFQNATMLRLFHFEDTDGDGTFDTWVDRTILPVDTVNQVICASVTSFSLFAAFERVNRPPVADAGPDQRLECGGVTGANATLDGSGSRDPDGDDLSFEWTDEAGAVIGNTRTVSLTLPIGRHPFRLRVDDGLGLSAEDDVVVAVSDTSPPAVASISASPNVLWPPNKKMVPVTVAVSASDRCDGETTCRIVSVASNGPGPGPGPEPDWEVVGDLRVNLRAEKSKGGRERIYTIVVECRDAAGNRTSRTGTVTVPHDQSGRD